MSLAYREGAGLWPIAALSVVLSAGAHVGLPAAWMARAPQAQPETRPVESGIQGAIMFDLSDIIAAPSEAGEDSVEMAASDEAPTVTESPEAVDPAKAAEIARTKANHKATAAAAVAMQRAHEAEDAADKAELPTSAASTCSEV